jgi:nitrilase
MTTRIALLQMNSSKFIERNLESVPQMIREAADRKVDAIFLPENFAALASEDPRAIGDIEANSSGPVRKMVSDLAKETGCWIFAGTIPSSRRRDGTMIDGGRVRAASLVFDSDGTEVARYDKIHMFDVDVADSQKHYLESEAFEPGDETVCIDSPAGRVGLSVCYDIRFPEIYRRYFAERARCFTIPSAFTKPTGAAHFEILMRARAIENFAFTIAACQCGIHDSGRETYGNSMVVDPWGEILCRGGDDETVLVAELDFDRQDEIRRDMPVHDQRRL